MFTNISVDGIGNVFIYRLYLILIHRFFILFIIIFSNIILFHKSASATTEGALGEKAARLVREKEESRRELLDIIFKFPPRRAIEITLINDPLVRANLRDKTTASLTLFLRMRWSEEFFQRIRKLSPNDRENLISCYQGSLIEAKFYSSGIGFSLFRSTPSVQISIDGMYPSRSIKIGDRILSDLEFLIPGGFRVGGSLIREFQAFSIGSPGIPIEYLKNSGEVRYKIVHGRQVGQGDSCNIRGAKFDDVTEDDVLLINTRGTIADAVIAENSVVDELVEQVGKLIIPATHKLYPIQVVGEPKLISIVDQTQAYIEIKLKVFWQIGRYLKLSEILSKYKIDYLKDKVRGRSDLGQYDVCFGEDHCFRGLPPMLLNMLVKHCENSNSDRVYGLVAVRDDGMVAALYPGRGHRYFILPDHLSCGREAYGGWIFAPRNRHNMEYQWTENFFFPISELGKIKQIKVSRISAPARK